MADRPTFIMVPRRLMYTWVAVTLVLFISILSSFQYANYVDRESNKQWCSVISLFNQAYRENPPPSELGKKIAAGMLVLQQKFSCGKT